MKFMNWMMGLVSRLMNWWTRPRNIGLQMVKWSSLLLASAVSGGYVLQLRIGHDSSFLLSTAEGTPAFIYNLVVGVGLLGLVAGFAFAGHWYVQEARITQVSRVLVVELRGLVDTSGVA